MKKTISLLSVLFVGFLLILTSCSYRQNDEVELSRDINFNVGESFLDTANQNDEVLVVECKEMVDVQTHNGESVGLEIDYLIVEDESNYTGYYILEVLKCDFCGESQREVDYEVKIQNVFYHNNHQNVYVQLSLGGKDFESVEIQTICIDLYEINA